MFKSLPPTSCIFWGVTLGKNALSRWFQWSFTSVLFNGTYKTSCSNMTSLAIGSILHYYEILPYCILSCRYPTTITYPLVPQTEMSLWNALLATLLIQQSHWVTLDRCQNTVSCHSSDSCLMWFVLLLHLPLYWSFECSVAEHVGHELHVARGSQDCGPSGHPHF